MRRRRSNLLYLTTGIIVVIIVLIFFRLQPSAESVAKPQPAPAQVSVERIVKRGAQPECAKRHEQQGQDCFQRAPVFRLPEACPPVLRALGISRRTPRYVLALQYSKQQLSAVDNLFHLSALAGAWKAKVVLPFTADSNLVGLPAHDRSAAPLEFLFDKQHLDNLSCSYGLPPFVAFEHFLQSASRKAIMIHLVHPSDKRGNQADSKLVAHKMQYAPIVDCSESVHLRRTANNAVKVLEREASKVLTSGFKLDDIVCVNVSHPTSLDGLFAKIKLTDFGTVILTNWRGTSTTGERREGREGLLSAIVQEPLGRTLKSHKFPTSALDYFRPSQCVGEVTDQFVGTALSAQEFMAIHFHSEKLGEADKVMPGYFKKCFARAMQLRNAILEDEEALLPVHYFADYGSYGSQICENCHGAIMLDAAIMLHVSGRNC